jgi:Zn-dependent membrane protease YugP
MLIIIGALVLLALIFLPGLWVQRVLSKYSRPTDRYPGTGGELARHLLDGLGLEDVKVEQTDQGDHYDPQARAVRLTPEKYAGKSLTAITVAAHEVGHAHQDARAYPPLKWRTRLVKLVAPAQRLGAGILMLAPLIGIALRTPAVGVLMFFGGLLAMGTTTVIHLVTLPTELDASFGRALPLLRKGGYLQDGDEPHARKLLQAAALTYVAASLMSLLNVARWWAILRR